MTRPNGVTTAYTYDSAGRLASLIHTGPGSVTGSSQSFSYNAANQTLTNIQATAAYLWGGHPTSVKNATHDGLNRDAAVVASNGYDANGALTYDGTRTYAYDLENRLISVRGGNAGADLTYDPLGRLLKTASAGVETIFTYDGQNLVKESAAATALDRRYVHGLGVDEPLIWYEGGPTGTANWLLSDRQGSIVATAGSSGVMSPLTYGPYGEPQTWAGSRFRYTGQIAIPEAQLYHYKARAYDPVMGRFLQTDPIGYGDGPNVYAYVHGDPVNGSDPTGMNTPVDEVLVRFDPCRSYGASCQYITSGIDSFVGQLQYASIDAANFAGITYLLTHPDQLKIKITTCETKLPDGTTVAEHVESANKHLDAKVNELFKQGVDAEAIGVALIQEFIETVGSGSDIDFKNNFKGDGDAIFLGDAGNFAYGAIAAHTFGTIEYYKVIALSGAEVYAAKAGHTDTAGTPFLKYPYGADASAQRAVEAGMDAECNK